MSSCLKQRRLKHSTSRHNRGRSACSFMAEEQAPALTLPMLSRSNLDCFLDYVTPSVQCQHSVKSCLADVSSDGRNKIVPFFRLCDLWSSFDEWSAYGAGVPLTLPSGDTVMQYYVPYLSAMQIYLQPGCSACSNKRQLGEESDWSDVSDMRDLSSDYGTDNESDKILSRWDGSSCLSSERLSSPSSEQSDQLGDLLFEFFERGPPYSRAPLAGKIKELATGLPDVLTLSSHQLSPASWISVAWYPIYRIPTGYTMSNLSTCFLTYHSLWTPNCLQDEAICAHHYSNFAHMYVCDQIGDDVCSLDFNHISKQEQWLGCHSAWRMKSRDALEIPPFAMASYKLRGPFWESAAPADEQRLASLVSTADAWLRQLGVQHPDFDFFASREGVRMYG